MKPFKHYILTRFNLGVYDPASAYYQKTVIDPDDWMKHRMMIFERYCLPSVLGQTDKDFTWLMAFDEDTPTKIVLRYDYMENVEICYEQPHFYLRKKKPEAEWLITSRFDNDDVYIEDFAQQIHAAFNEVEEVIDIDYHALDLASGKRYTSGRRRPNSPFLSLVEPWHHDPFTAMGRPHTFMVDQYPARKLDGIHAVQLIHDRNVSNKICGVEV